MKKKIAILRGINVGGKRKILMADLKALFHVLGFSDIKTYIQSGNVIFSVTENADDLLIAFNIEQAIFQEFGFDVPVIIRDATELGRLVSKNPFLKEDSDIKQLHVTFLNQLPSEEDLQQTQTYLFEPDQFSIDQKEVFIYCDGKYHQSKLTNNFFEQKLKVKATTRNWKTVLKLIELSANE